VILAARSLGSLDILIPPSVILIVYGAFAEQSIAKLYLAGFIPGGILALFFIAVIYIWVRLYPKDAPTVEVKLTLRQKFQKTTHSLIFLLLMAACLGTIYVGIATPTEAAGLGAFFTALTAFIMKRLTWSVLKESLLSTVSVTCMVLFLVMGGLILSNFLMSQNIPNEIMEYTFSLGLTGWKLLLVLYIVYALMGCLIVGLTLIIITLSIVVNMMKKMGVDLIWLGIVMVMMVELAQLHPPVGMNLFIVRNISKGKIEDVIIGSAPFLFAIIAALVLVTIFPSIVVYLPRLIKY
jgi:C4-dicarboxylate transporter DctM subunit